MSTVYKDYFQIDDNYFPCVNESAINAGLKWDGFYPHSTFIDLLRKTERVLSRQEKRSIWISGAYGTGKSYAAFTLSKLLTAPIDEVEAYFQKYEALAPYRTDLMQKIIAAKKEGLILACHRYASSSISNSNDLIIVMQDVIAKTIKKAGLQHTGANTIKQGILTWLKDERNKLLFNGYVEREYKDLFGGWSADDIIKRLEGTENTVELVGNINKMASEIGILAIKIDMDGLIAYIKDIIDGNSLKALVFVMDEFSEFFINNRGQLTDFQKLVEICAEVPFYLTVVAHNMTSYFHEKDNDARKLRDRFIPCEIEMPDTIAFDLMCDALKIRDDVKDDWNNKLDDLQDFTKKSRRAVSDCTGIEYDVLKGVLPLHPMSALLLKHISTAFESNQRSMFDFIKNDGNYRAFQWFIDNHGPLDGTTALLTVDMLWDFFYETGKDNLALSIRNILDTYKKAEQQRLTSEEQQVLKTVLIMQAVSSHLNDAIPLFITNEQNLHLCFEGTDYEYKAAAIAEKLVREEVLYKKAMGGGKFCYASMVMVGGDAAELDKRKKEKIEKLRTLELCTEDMTRVFNLTAPLKLRYDLTFAVHEDITSKTNRYVNEEGTSNFHAIVGVAKDDNEAVLIRKLMQDKIRNVVPDNRNIVFIDTTPTPLGSDSIDQYAEYMAGSEMLRNRDPAAADDLLRKGKMVAGSWGNRIYSNQIIVYSKSNPEGERFTNWQQALNGLRNLVKVKYPYVFEFSPDLTEATLQAGSKAQWVEAGITGKASGLTSSAERLVSAARRDDEYWITDSYSSLGVVKNAIDKKIKQELSDNSKIAIKEALSLLCDEYGFVPSNLYSFLTGFILKEYAVDTYRLSDEANNEKMSVQKMKEIVDEAYKQFYAPNSRYRDKYIRIMSHEEQLFCALISEVFDIPDSQCGSVEDAIKRVRISEKSKGLPAWVLIEKASRVEVDFINEFVKILNPEQGVNTSIISGNIGKMVESDDRLITRLKDLVTDESRQESMKNYLSMFEDGKLLSIAREIGVEDRVVSDIQRFFGEDSEGLWLWNRETGEGQIRKVLRDYEFIKKSNELLIKQSSSVANALASWQEKLRFVKISHEMIREIADYAPFTDILYNVAIGIGKDHLKELFGIINTHGDAIVSFLRSDREIFGKVCAFQLQGLSEQEVADIYKSIPNGCFTLDKQEYLQKIEQIVREFISNLAKIQLRNLWKEKTATNTPYEWSEIYRTPLLSCVPRENWSDFKRAFEAVNRQNPEDTEVKYALEFLNANPIWNSINDQKIIDNAFRQGVLGNYRSILLDLDEVRDYLAAKTAISTYDWAGQDEVRELVEKIAQSKYGDEPYNRVVRRIDSMDDAKLRNYMKRLVKDNMIVGIEILEDDKER